MCISTKFKRMSFVSSLGFFLLSAGNAQAGPIFTYDPSSSSVTLTPAFGVSLDGLVEATVHDEEEIFELSSIGDSFDFDFLSITSTGAFIGSAGLEATLAFSTPSEVSGTGSGFGVGGSSGDITFLGSLFASGSFASITWTTDPGLLSFSDGTEVFLSFEDVSDSSGCFGFEACSHFTGGLGLSVAATTELTAVPEPSVLALMGIGLVGAGFVSRRRRVS